jgi:glycosyltransferase involved in cell wall biosynthesis
MRATVVVCTHNRAALLADCLASIAADTSTVEREVLVVDNASTDGTRDVVAKLPNVRYVREDRLGHAHARNRAVREARGEVLLLTDDDVLVRDGWADALAAPFADPAVAAAGGKVEPLWEQPPPDWLGGPMLRLLAMVDHGDSPRPLGPKEFPVGANMAVRASALAGATEPFDVTTGHRGDVAMGHEEKHFLQRLQAGGRLVAWAPGAVVAHRVDAKRMDRDWLRTAAYQNGFGKARMERVEGVLPRLPRRVAALARDAVAARRARRGPLTQEGVTADVRAHQALGYDVEALLGRFPALTLRLARR